MCLKLMETEVDRLCMFMRDVDQCDPRIEKKLVERIDADRFKIDGLDLSYPQRIEQKFGMVMKNHFHGKLDAVILCHGIVVEKGIIGCNVPDFDQTMLINVRSMTHIISLAMPFLKV